MTNSQASTSQADDRAEPVDFEKFWSSEGRRRLPGMLQGLVVRFAGMPDVIALHGGLPPATAFPFTGASFTLQDASQLTLQPAASTMALAQQYNLGALGHPPLVAWARGLTLRQHAPPRQVEVMITNGSTHAIETVMRCLLDPGDALLLEEFTYSHVLEMCFRPHGYRLLPVQIDARGLVPASLRATCLAAVQQEAAGGPRAPRVLYIIPTGQNPTSAVLTQERKREIYQICREYDILIVEDDAYYWLQYATTNSTGSGSDTSSSSTDAAAPVPGLQLPPSFLSMDVDGRVVRLDTMAKLLGPGYRLGWLTAAPAAVERLALAVSGSSVGPNSFSQVVLHQLLQHWGDAGFVRFVESLQRLYGRQAAIASSSAVEYLTGLAECTPATAGMFLWVKVSGHDDADEVVDAMITAGVVAVPGKAFWVCRDEPGAKCPYLRISYASVPEETLRLGFQKLRDVLRNCKSSRDKRVSAPCHSR